MKSSIKLIDFEQDQIRKQELQISNMKVGRIINITESLFDS